MKQRAQPPPLVSFALHDNKHMVRHLLRERKVDPNVVDVVGRTAAYVFALRNDADMVRCCVEAGSRVDVDYAIPEQGDTAVVQLEDGETGIAIIVSGISYRLSKVATVKCRFVAPPRVNGETKSVRITELSVRKTLLSMLVTSESSTSAAKFLLEAGADANTADAAGNTMMCRAASRSDERMMRCLLSGGADVNKANGDGNSPLLVLLQSPAVILGRGLSAVRCLVEAGADLNFTNAGDTYNTFRIV